MGCEDGFILDYAVGVSGVSGVGVSGVGVTAFFFFGVFFLYL